MELKYFTINSKETTQELLRRVRFEVKALEDFTVSDISELMGRGVRVITLINTTFSSKVKLEVLEIQVDEILEKFKTSVIHNKPLRINKRSDGLGDIGDLY